MLADGQTFMPGSSFSPNNNTLSSLFWINYNYPFKPIFCVYILTLVASSGSMMNDMEELLFILILSCVLVYVPVYIKILKGIPAVYFCTST